MDFMTKAAIVSEIWTDYRDDEEFAKFVEYNDIGLPLAYFIVNELVTPTEQAEGYVEEAYHLLVYSLKIEDKDYANLDEMLAEAEK
jgi:hypothetical protein